MRCHFIKYKGNRILIPGCWNRVIHGDSADCHCDKNKKSYEEELNSLKERVKKLEAIVLGSKHNKEEGK